MLIKHQAAFVGNTCRPDPRLGVAQCFLVLGVCLRNSSGSYTAFVCAFLIQGRDRFVTLRREVTRFEDGDHLARPDYLVLQ